MEVHHHSHAHGKKKFKEYLLEFIMLFLAVTLGFLAENLREHLTEQKKEKEYIASFIGDLQSDTADISATTKRLFGYIHGEDSLIFLLQHYADTDSINKKCYRYFIQAGANVDFVTFNQNTLNQLLNTGSMRLIGKQNITDSIMTYSSITKAVNLQEQYYNDEFKKAFDYASNIFDFSYLHYRLTDSFNVKPTMRYDTAHFNLVSNSPDVLRKYAAYLIMQQNLSSGYLMQLKYAREYAQRLIVLLKEQYHVKKEN